MNIEFTDKVKSNLRQLALKFIYEPDYKSDIVRVEFLESPQWPMMSMMSRFRIFFKGYFDLIYCDDDDIDYKAVSFKLNATDVTDTDHYVYMEYIPDKDEVWLKKIDGESIEQLLEKGVY